MANKQLFQSRKQRALPPAQALNEEMAPAYQLAPAAALAQYAATGCLNATFYATAGEQLDQVLTLSERVEPEFLARAALYARRQAHMKDMPALLCAVLSAREPGLLAKVFERVIDNGRMLRSFVQIMRSGAVGRRSLGTLPKRLARRWLDARSDEAIFRASVGNNPSLADIVKMVHPKPQTASRKALYAYLVGRDYDRSELPKLARLYEAFKRGNDVVPDVPFQMLTSLDLKPRHWKNIARRAPWQMTRMNLNTFARHGVFDDRPLTGEIAGRLRNPELIAQARVLPYQLLVAYLQTDSSAPAEIRDALQDAMEIAIQNVPRIEGQVYVCPDISGSMHSPVTGYRPGASSVVRCVDVAALAAAAVLRNNPRAEALPFADDVSRLRLNPRDSVMTNARWLTSLPAGGTNCSAPLAELNRRGAKGDLVIFVSDNESWLDARRPRFFNDPTMTMHEWARFKLRNPRAKLVCIDLQPYGTTQACERPDILNIGGFSDRVFDVIRQFAAGTLSDGHWVDVINGEAL